ncbi:KR-domain-containing protein [Dendrothele bispora CBS 962.96]|uniref:KR-domain-containing protein n=1 Tax=Dendrothele bispora (strain CBS 962.96) TaxID=1314807 RepID=A0A4V4HED5_DENBC|nr:KR-domain-containing protein [Dendrothele bispora CBS 962.96]
MMINNKWQLLYRGCTVGEGPRKYSLLSFDDQDKLDSSPNPFEGYDDPAMIKYLSSSKDRKLCVVLDTTLLTDITPNSPEFSVMCKHVLWLMKVLVGGQIRFSSFVVISSYGLSIDNVPKNTSDYSLSALGSVVHGMLRVFRREMALRNDDMVWGIDVSGSPRVDISSLSSEEWKRIIRDEFFSRSNGLERNSIVVYQMIQEASLRSLKSSNFSRFVMVQEDAELESIAYTTQVLDKKTESVPDGVTVIAGMGSIGCALAQGLVSFGIRRVVLLGRRHKQEISVQRQLSAINKGPGEVTYMQTDICDIEALRNTFNDIQQSYGTIHNIIHAAGVIQDALISNVTFESFQQVMKPKVQGGWNLHKVSEEMNLVEKGNPGQIAYVAANSFLESLAAYRQTKGLPGISLELELGPWESEHVERLGLEKFSKKSKSSIVKLIRHEEGVPLLIKAMFDVDRKRSTNSISIGIGVGSSLQDDSQNFASVQLLAKLDLGMMKGVEWIRDDPMWSDVLLRGVGSSTTVVDSEKAASRMSLSRSSSKVWTRSEVEGMIVDSLKYNLELRDGNLIDLEESLNSCGVDSICFAQIQAQVISDWGVDIPIAYLSDTFKIRELIDYVFARLSRPG